MYSMSTRDGSIITKKNADNLEEAVNYFIKMKKLPKSEFLKIFKVEKIK